MRVVALVMILAGIAAAAFVGIGGGVSPWKEQDFVDMNVADMHHALAVVLAGSLVALAIVSRQRTVLAKAITAVAGLCSVIAGGILGVSMLRLDKLYWREQPFLTFAVIFAGGLVAMALSGSFREPKQPSRSKDDKGDSDAA